MNEYALKTVITFNKPPETDEIKEIKRQFLNSEITAFELFSIASEYLENHNENI